MQVLSEDQALGQLCFGVVNFAGRVHKRPARDAHVLVLSERLDGVELYGTMACAPGADNFDFRIYIKVAPPQPLPAGTSSAGAATSVNPNDTIVVKGLGRFGVGLLPLALLSCIACLVPSIKVTCF
jgi:hypothetical protein